MTFTHAAERLIVKLSLNVLTTFRGLDLNPDLPHAMRGSPESLR